MECSEFFDNELEDKKAKYDELVLVSMMSEVDPKRVDR